MWKTTILLDGQWMLRFCDSGQGETANWPRTVVSGVGALPAQVPIDVHLEMMQAGVIEDSLFGEHAGQCEWIEEMD